MTTITPTNLLFEVSDRKIQQLPRQVAHPHHAATVSTIFRLAVSMDTDEGLVNVVAEPSVSAAQRVIVRKFVEFLNLPAVPNMLFGMLTQRETLNVVLLNKACYQTVVGSITGKMAGNGILAMAGHCSGLGNVCADKDGKLKSSFTCHLCAQKLCWAHHILFRCRGTRSRTSLCVACKVRVFDTTGRLSSTTIRRDHAVQCMYQCICGDGSNPKNTLARRTAGNSSDIYRYIEFENIMARQRQEKYPEEAVKALHRIMGWGTPVEKKVAETPRPLRPNIMRGKFYV